MPRGGRVSRPVPMRMRHRWIALALTLALGASALVACGPPGGVPGPSSADATDAAEPSGMDHSMAPAESTSAAPSAEESEEEEYEY